MVGCAGIPQGVSDMVQHEKMMAAKRRGVLPSSVTEDEAAKVVTDKVAVHLLLCIQ